MDAIQKGPRQKGLGQKPGWIGRVAFFSEGVLAVPRHEDHGQFGLSFPESPGQFETIDARHHHVGDQRVDFEIFLFQFLEQWFGARKSLQKAKAFSRKKSSR